MADLHQLSTAELAALYRSRKASPVEAVRAVIAHIERNEPKLQALYAYDPEAALAEIRRCAGTQFDPALTDAFLSIGADRFRELLMDHKRQAKQLIEMQQALRAA